MALLPEVIGCNGMELQSWRPMLAHSMFLAVRESHPDLQQWMPWAQTLPTEDDLAAVLSQGDVDFQQDRGWDYALVEPRSTVVLGCAGVHRTDRDERFAIGYWVRTSRTGRGLATAATRVLTKAAFEFLENAQLIVISMDQANAASAAIPPKLGFSLMGSEDREIRARGHTGHGLVWGLGRT
jgi:RimJ/RimL family protein N-acetyltransferase